MLHFVMRKPRKSARAAKSSSSTTMPTAVVPSNPQENCRLLNTPLEIRLRIYHYIYIAPHGVHASIQGGRLVFSTCVQPSPNADLYGGERRGLLKPGSDYEHPLYAPRLRSTWGPHWKCEEMALKINHSKLVLKRACLDVLNVCRRL